MSFLFNYRKAHDLITKILYSKDQNNDVTDHDLLSLEHGPPLHLDFDTQDGQIGFQRYKNKKKIHQFIF